MATETVKTAAGPVEVQRVGEGEPVLVVHGSPGGCDNAFEMGRFLLTEEFSLIAPSRPGYQGTPLDSGRTPAEQGELLAALLDALGLDRIALLCWSGGGPASWALASAHPERVSAIAAAAAVSGPIDQKLAFEERFAMRTRMGNLIARQMLVRSPDAAIASALNTEGTLEHNELEELTKLVAAEPAMRNFVLSLTELIGSFRKERRAGFDNDVRWFGELEPPDFGAVTAPTLLIHGDADAEVGIEHSERAAAAIARAELLEVPRGTHVALWAHPDAPAAQRRVAVHLRR